MKAVYNKALAGLVAWLITSPVWAADGTTISEISEAAKRAGDKSREALVAIYGNVVNNPLAGGDASGDTILASIFQVFNGALLVVGSIWACYIIFRKLTRTAHEGSAFDRQQGSFWGPVRLVWGLVSLVPTASGWSLSQLLMLWGASVMGVGVANLGVDSAISAFSSGTSMVVQPVMPSTVSLAHGIFEANLCLWGINAGIYQAQQSGALVTKAAYVQQNPTNTGFILKNASFVCGGADVRGDLEAQAVSTDWFSGTIDVSTIRKAHMDALRVMQKSLSATAENFVNAVVLRERGETNTLPDAEQAIQAASQAYENAVNTTAGTKQGSIGELAKKMSDNIKEAGWWTLGAWYQTFAQANTKLSDAMAAKASTFGISSGGDPAVTGVYTSAMNAYKTQQDGSTYVSTLGSQSSGDYSKGAGGSDAGAVIGSIFSSPGQRLVNFLTDQNLGAEGMGQVNPLIKMKNLGDYTLGVAETALGGYVAARAIKNIKDGWSVAGVVAKVANVATSVGDAFTGVLDGLSPFIIGLIVTFFILGATLSTYLPMVPFIIWFGAAVNWLVVVGEAVIAAPLWALTHLGGEGDGMGQKTSHGYIFLLDVMVRPILMVLGFFLGGAALIAGGTLLNQLFGVALANAQYDSFTGLLSIIFFLMIYCSMCLNLVHSCFNLIMIVPDQVINWVGGHSSSIIGREDNERMRSAMTSFGGKLDQLAPKSGKPKPGPAGAGPGDDAR